MSQKLALLRACLAALLTLAAAQNTTLADSGEPGCVIPVAAADVPQNLADTLAAAFVDGFVALPYTPFLGGCRAYQTRAMEACYEDEADGRHWAVDVAVNCTDGAWAAVSTILVHGVAVESQEGNLTVVSSELGTEISVTEPGDGGFPLPGYNITMDYSLFFSNGTLIESTEGGAPFVWPLGIGKLIRSWDEGVQLMRVGESATLVARPSFAYGANGTGDGAIPGNTTLVFVLTLLDAEETSDSAGFA